MHLRTSSGLFRLWRKAVCDLGGNFYVERKRASVCRMFWQIAGYLVMRIAINVVSLIPFVIGCVATIVYWTVFVLPMHLNGNVIKWCYFTDAWARTTEFESPIMKLAAFLGFPATLTGDEPIQYFRLNVAHVHLGRVTIRPYQALAATMAVAFIAYLLTGDGAHADTARLMTFKVGYVILSLIAAAIAMAVAGACASLVIFVVYLIIKFGWKGVAFVSEYARARWNNVCPTVTFEDDANVFSR